MRNLFGVLKKCRGHKSFKAVLLGSLLVLFLPEIACSTSEKRDYEEAFSQLTYPSSEWLATDFGVAPSKEGKAILEKNKPQFWISKESCRPMDYYKQFAPKLTILKGDQETPATRDSLKAYERDFSTKIKIIETPKCLESSNPPLYASTWNEKLELADGKAIPIQVLRYSFAFYKSGLPEKRSFLQGFGRILGSQSHWHFLDLHGAVFYLLNSEGQLFSVVLAQHNHFRSYVVGVDIDEADAKRICFSNRSNEPYFCSQDEQVVPTAPTFKFMRWIATGKDRPFAGAWDVIPSEAQRTKISDRLEFLTSRDPLITSWAPLGPNLKIWGLFSTFFRNAAPGTAIFTMPPLKPVWKTAQYFYFSPDDSEVFDINEEISKDFLTMVPTRVLKINGKRYNEAVVKSLHR